MTKESDREPEKWQLSPPQERLGAGHKSGRARTHSFIQGSMVVLLGYPAEDLWDLHSHRIGCFWTTAPTGAAPAPASQAPQVGPSLWGARWHAILGRSAISHSTGLIGPPGPPGPVPSGSLSGILRTKQGPLPLLCMVSPVSIPVPWSTPRQHQTFCMTRLWGFNLPVLLVSFTTTHTWFSGFILISDVVMTQDGSHPTCNMSAWPWGLLSSFLSYAYPH